MKNTTQTNNGKKGGLLKGKPHYDKNGKPLGGIKAVVTDSGQQVELEGGEVIINKEASKKHWKELSRINQSAGNGVPILPPDDTDSDVDTEDFEKGGKIDFNPNKIPSKKVYNYAKKIKEKYPKVWDMGGNIFGNEAYKNLERALKRGYWLDSEDWMYKKWQSFNARHSGDIRIAGIIANLKWLNVVNKGWQYMKDLIEAEIEKKYGDNKMAEGGKLIKRADGSYSRHGLWDSIRENAGSGRKPTKEMLRQEAKIKSEMAKGGVVDNKFQENLDELLKAEGWSISYWDKNINDVPKEKAYQMSLSRFDPYYESIAIKLPSKMEVTFDWVMNKINKDKVYKSFSENFNKLLKKKGFGDINSYPTTYGLGVFVGFGSHISETKKNIENLLNSLGLTYTTEYSDAYYVFRYKISKSKENIEKIEQLEMKLAKGGELAKGIKVEKEHSKTANKLYNRKITPQQSFEEIAKDHLKEDKNYYSKLAVFENKMADGGNVDVSKFSFKTPTGKPSKLTYLQQILVRTKGFKEWFGDWEAIGKEFNHKLNEKTTDIEWFNTYKNCSKIIDGETLEPRLVFHGTRNDDEFYKFETSVRNFARPYSYFAFNREYSEGFTNSQNWGGMYDCFVSVKNPLLMMGRLFENTQYDAKNWMFALTTIIFRDKHQREINPKIDKQFISDIIDDIGYYLLAVENQVGNELYFWKFMAFDINGDFKAFLQKYGYDGVIYTEQAFVGFDINNPAEYTRAVTIFDSNQVKLGDGRNVNFSKTNDDIRYKRGGTTNTSHKLNDKTHHYSLAKAIFGDGGEIVEKQNFDNTLDKNHTNREFVEDLIKKMQ